MKKIFYALIAVCSATASFAQGPVYNRCMSPQAIQYQENITPGYVQDITSVFNNANAYVSNPEAKVNSTYTIPVVVHIVYNIGAQNIDDSVVFNQIQSLNDDYNRENADTINMRSDFDIVAGNPSIKFKLAQIDEFGNATTGITRTNTPLASFGSLAIVGGDFSDLEMVKSTADGGQDAWDQSRYLNIWVCNMSVNFLGQEITALLGYATPPSNLPNWPPGSTAGISDGVVIQYQAFGSNNPNILDAGAGPIQVLGRTCSHEVGHYLGLRHIWGDGDCTAQDGIDDTPNAADQSQQDCDPSKNTCVDNIQGIDLPDMIENYMDYSSEECQNSFTQGQVTLMHGVLEDQRYDLVHGNAASIDEIKELAWMISPNPTDGEITISSIDPIQNIQIISLAGRIVKQIQPNGNETIIDLHNLESGIYFVTIESNGVHSSQRVVVK
jgi:hypothetical protein